MKYVFIVLAVIILALIAFQLWAKSTSTDIEMYPYEVIKEYDEFELRQYSPANFSTVTMDMKSYEESSSSGFRTLANYIFGGNESGEKISMTSPVEMELKDSVTMKFMIPSKYKISDLPEPEDKKIKFTTEPAKKVAAIRFGGWANDEKIEKYKNKLAALLKEKGIEHTGNFSFLGYDAPFVWFNRRNEVIVEVTE